MNSESGETYQCDSNKHVHCDVSLFIAAAELQRCQNRL